VLLADTTIEYITGSAVVLHCVKAHTQSHWRSPNLTPCENSPLNFKNLTLPT